LIPLPRLSEIQDRHRTVCLFEKPEDAARIERLVLGFADGHAESMPLWEVEGLVEAQTGKTLEELIERQRAYQPPAE
jgi:hypothetical protein